MKIIGAIPGGGGGAGLVLQTNGVPNGLQTLLNLAQSGIITLTDDGAGTITINVPAPVYPVKSVAGKTGDVVLAEGDITNLVADLAAKAPLASPAFTGTPTAPTPAPGDNTTKIATTAFVQSALSGGGFSLISKTVLSVAAATVNIVIPAGFTNLLIFITARSNSTSGSGLDNMWAQFNGDTGANYYQQTVGAQFGGTGFNNAQNAIANATIASIGANNAGASVAGDVQIMIPNYIGTAFKKQARSSWGVWQGGSNAMTSALTDFLWNNTAAINAILFGVSVGFQFVVGSTFCVYGC